MGAADRTNHDEHEAKLLPAPDFELSGLADTVSGTTLRVLDAQDLMATYFDTPALTLARAGITVRHRTGDGPPRWTVKLPLGRRPGTLDRREVTIEGPRNRRPREVAATVAAHLRGRRLTAVADLHTVRSRIALVDADDQPLVEVVHDFVTASRGRDPLGSWEEIEVEAADHPRAAKAQRQVVRALHRMGCGDLPSLPKLVRALGPDAEAPPEVTVPDLDEAPTVAATVHRALARSIHQLLRHDPLVRAGGDPEDLHQLRVAVRRLRSDLHTFAELLDRDEAAALRDELGWVVDETNEARDLDVLRAWLVTQGALLPAVDAEAVNGLLARRDEQAERARSRVLRALGSSRYLDLVHQLVTLAEHPPAEAKRREAKSRRHLHQLGGRRWRDLEQKVDALAAEPTDARLHKARIAAKKCRAAVEALRPLEGKSATRLARSLAGLQDVLGAAHDAAVFEAWLRSIDDPGLAFVAGQLTAAARADAAGHVARWPQAWADVLQRQRTW